MSNPQGQWDEPNVRVSGLGKPAVVGLILVVLWSLGQFVPVVSWFSRDGFYAAAATTGTVIPVVLASLALFTRSASWPSPPPAGLLRRRSDRSS